MSPLPSPAKPAARRLSDDGGAAGQTEPPLDITEQEAMEIVRALRRAQADGFVYESAVGLKVSVLDGTAEPYRVMVDTIGEGAVVLDQRGIVLFANPAMGRLVALNADQLVGHRLGGHMKPAADEVLSGSLPALMKGGTLDVELRRGDELVPVHLSARPIHFAGFDAAIVVATEKVNCPATH